MVTWICKLMSTQGPEQDCNISLNAANRVPIPYNPELSGLAFLALKQQGLRAACRPLWTNLSVHTTLKQEGLLFAKNEGPFGAGTLGTAGEKMTNRITNQFNA